jgi:hypothetical protein
MCGMAERLLEGDLGCCINSKLLEMVPPSFRGSCNARRVVEWRGRGVLAAASHTRQMVPTISDQFQMASFNFEVVRRRCRRQGQFRISVLLMLLVNDVWPTVG